MRTLSIVRHAKSSWSTPALKDIDRPLNGRGKKQAKRLGSYLTQIDSAPDLIICSSATRAAQTLKKMKANWHSDATLIVENRLYLASVREIERLLDEHGATCSHIMIIGHNPGLHMLADDLAVRGDAQDLALLREKYPTGTLCVLELDITAWNKIANAAGKLIYLATPKQLAAK